MSPFLPTASSTIRRRRPSSLSQPSPINVSTPPIRIIGSEPRTTGGFWLADR